MTGELRRLTRGAVVWQETDFVRLWAGQAISQVGSQVTAVALPLIAVAQLHASAADMGALTAAGRLPFLLYLVAGAWVDRVRMRLLLLGTDLARGVFLLVIPVCAAAHLLSVWLLGVIFAGASALSVWFDTAYMSYLPLLIDRRLLMQGNTIMQSFASTAQVIGPSLGGFLVQVLSAPIAVIADALSFFASAFSLWRIRRHEPKPDRGGSLDPRRIIGDIGPGVSFVVRHPILGPLALAIGINNAVWAAETALYVLYLHRGLALSAALIGLILAAGGPGALAGSALAGRVQRRFGVAAAIIGGLATFAAGALLIPLAPGRHEAAAVGVLMVAAFAMSAGGQVCAVNVLTTRQMIAPDHLLGRVNASFRFVGLGVSPLGALLGGLLGATLGLRGGLLAAVCGMFLAPAIVAASPVRRLRSLPTGTSKPEMCQPETEKRP
jgi:MFS family permease